MNLNSNLFAKIICIVRWICKLAQWSSDSKDEHQVSGQSDNDEADGQGQDCVQVTAVGHVQLLQELGAGSEVTERHRTIELRPLATVHGHHGTFEGVAHETDVCQPVQVHRYGTQVHEEAGEQQERDGGRGCRKHCDLSNYSH